MQTANVFIAVPSGRALITSETNSTLIALTHHLRTLGAYGGFGTLTFPDVVEVRNLFLTIWYDRLPKCTHLLMIDDDMGFAPNLIEDMLRMNQPLVGALCPKRKIPIEFAGRARPGNCKIVNGHMEVDGVGGAVMLIRRDCVDAILKNDPSIVDTKSIPGHAAKSILDEHGATRLIKGFNKVVIDGEEFSEDLSFCWRWKRTGGEIWANITHKISHVGPHAFTGCFYDQIKDQIKYEGGNAPAQPVAPEPPPELVAEFAA